MNTLIAKKLVGVLVRYALFAVGLWLTQHQALSEDQAKHMTSPETVDTVVGVLVAIAPVLWAMRGQIAGLRELVAAFHLSPGATMDDVKVRASEPDIRAASLAAK